jgi:hypothetical protein
MLGVVAFVLTVVGGQGSASPRGELHLLDIAAYRSFLSDVTDMPDEKKNFL